jgi:hypothetical protein
MSIPELAEHGFLPDGIYDCTPEEMARRFGGFQGSDCRPRLWHRFIEFLKEVKTCGLIQELLIDGSFISDKTDPNDIDLILVVSSGHDFTSDLRPSDYNVFSKKRVRKRYGFDILIARAGTEEVADIVEFFRQVRGQPLLRKGLLRLRL